jgi:hypothetical protein
MSRRAAAYIHWDTCGRMPLNVMASMTAPGGKVVTAGVEPQPPETSLLTLGHHAAQPEAMRCPETLWKHRADACQLNSAGQVSGRSGHVTTVPRQSEARSVGVLTDGEVNRPAVRGASGEVITAATPSRP